MTAGYTFTEWAVRRALRAHPKPIGVAEIVAHSGLPVSFVRRALGRLLAAGDVVAAGVTCEPAGHRRRLYLPVEATW